jgi:hypothetical protein
MQLENNIEALAYGMFLAVTAPSDEQSAKAETVCQELMSCMTEDEIKQAYANAEAMLQADAA